MYNFQPASKTDLQAIAQLHTRSWRLNYRGMLSDDYLDNEVENDRIQVWQERLANPSDKQLILLAKREHQLLGFACAYLDKDEVWGSYLDNLHVAQELQSQGIGKQLMEKVALWVKEKSRNNKLYLWVLAENIKAIKFYKRHGGSIHPEIQDTMPDGRIGNIVRVTWADAALLS